MRAFPDVTYRKSRLKKLCKIHRKLPMPQSLFQETCRLESWDFTYNLGYRTFFEQDVPWPLGNHHCTKKTFLRKDFFTKCDQIRNFQRIWSHFLKKSLMENFAFCAVHRLQIHSKMRTWHNKNIQSNAPIGWVLTTWLNHLASFAEWMSVSLSSTSLWVRIPLQSIDGY